MFIYLSQHGKSNPEEIDPDRKLSEQGLIETGMIGKTAKWSNVSVSRIVHSGKTRARETAFIYYDFLKPSGGIVETTGMNPDDSVAEFARTIVFDGTMYVGHLPFMERLLSYLILGTEDKTVLKFRNSGIVCLEKDDRNGAVVIRWAIIPDMSR